MESTLLKVKFAIKLKYFQETKILKQVKDGLKNISKEIKWLAMDLISFWTKIEEKFKIQGENKSSDTNMKIFYDH